VLLRRASLRERRKKRSREKFREREGETVKEREIERARERVGEKRETRRGGRTGRQIRPKLMDVFKLERRRGRGHKRKRQD